MNQALIMIGESYCFGWQYAFGIECARYTFGHPYVVYCWDDLDFARLDEVCACANEALIVCEHQNFQSIAKQLIQYSSLDACMRTLWGYEIQAKTCRILLQDPDFAHALDQWQFYFVIPLGFDLVSAKMLLLPLASKYGLTLVEYELAHFGILGFQTNKDMTRFQKEVAELFGSKILISCNLAQTIIQKLACDKKILTIAESCTGGLLAYFLTKQSGASEVFWGGMVSYDNAIKESWLGVRREHLEHFGAVSEVVVGAMLDGILARSNAHCAIAVSGIAGPNGGSESKPVGTIYIGVQRRNQPAHIERFLLKGNRQSIQEQACLCAYILFLKVYMELDK